ncbi:ATP-dependent endonuclease [Mycobacterium asiaticum]|nr:AAA family ATPase [Mycobacterium asiaticum]OBK92836.1 ATP-dependent endonuclease [Mycobacterium asiaticum]
MHISKLSLVNYRNFSNGRFVFESGVNTIIGENGSGKSNALRALRLLLDSNLLASAYRIGARDFHRGLEDWRGHWIIISVEFAEISADEAIQALFVHGTGNIPGDHVERATYNLIYRPSKDVRWRLAALTDGDHAGLQEIIESITTEDYETVFTGRSAADFNDDTVYKSIVGDFDLVKFNAEIDASLIGAPIPRQLSVTKEISFTFIQALRDVVQEFQDNRTNPLRSLLRHKSGEIDLDEFKVITDQVRVLNDKIEGWPDVMEIRDDVKQTVIDTVGAAFSPTSLSIKSDLPDDADRLFQSLKLFLGEHGEEHEGAIHELSLGGANLIYLTLKLLEFSYQKANRSVANFLLIEEPEAHIHTHIQRTLFNRLDYPDTQVIYSTHSPQISEVSNVQTMNILGREGALCEAYQPSAGLDQSQIQKIQRYLDAIRSNLLFAKSVILVEGDAEEILVPILVRKVLGVSLDELGVSLINIRSTGFENVAVLFHDERIKRRCSIVTDSDTAVVKVDPVTGDSEGMKRYREQARRSQLSGEARKAQLEDFGAGNPWLASFYADHTFEVDLITAGNSSLFVDVLGDVYSDQATIEAATAALESGEVSVYGRRALAMAKKSKKGWFAILLGGKVNHQTSIPRYILDALRFAQPALDTETVHHILLYRLLSGGPTGTYSDDTHAIFRPVLEQFRSGDIDLEAIKEHTKTYLTDDRIVDILQVY